MDSLIYMHFTGQVIEKKFKTDMQIFKILYWNR